MRDRSRIAIPVDLEPLMSQLQTMRVSSGPTAAAPGGSRARPASGCVATPPCCLRTMVATQLSRRYWAERLWSRGAIGAGAEAAVAAATATEAKAVALAAADQRHKGSDEKIVADDPLCYDEDEMRDEDVEIDDGNEGAKGAGGACLQRKLLCRRFWVRIRGPVSMVLKRYSASRR